MQLTFFASNNGENKFPLNMIAYLIMNNILFLYVSNIQKLYLKQN